LVLAGCTARAGPPSATPPVVLSAWRGYVYVAAGQPASVNFPLGLVGRVGSLFSASRFVFSPRASGVISDVGGSTPTSILDVNLSLPPLSRPMRFVPLIAHIQTAMTSANIPLGTWLFTPVAAGGPLAVTSWLGAVEGYPLPATIAFQVTFRVSTPSAVTHLTLLLNAPPTVVTARMEPPKRTGHRIVWAGRWLFHNRSTQLFLVPAVQYRVAGRTYTTVLMPFYTYAPPSRASSARYGVRLHIKSTRKTHTRTEP
jgi:hypothetical protein